MSFASRVRMVSLADASSDSAERARCLVYSASRQLAFAVCVMSNLRRWVGVGHVRRRVLSNDRGAMRD